MFYPLHDRSFFTNAQMSLIDRNFLLLNTTLENGRMNNQINNNNPNFNEMNFDVEMQNLLNPQNQNQNAPVENNENNIENLNAIVNPPHILNEEENSIHQNLLQGAPVVVARENVILNPENVQVGEINAVNQRGANPENQKYNRME